MLVIWNKYGHYAMLAKQAERAGALVLVAENGYLGFDKDGHQHYALARNAHNGAGDWFVGGPERFEALGIELQPWQQGKHIAVRGQRGIGCSVMSSPPDWHGLVAKRLRSIIKREIVVHRHPGNGAVTDRSHEQYLQGAHALVIWSSSVGVKALVMGIPVFYEAPHWICAGAAVRGIANIEQPKIDDAARLAAMQRMAWAQWSVAELATGEPFVRLAEKEQAAA